MRQLLARGRRVLGLGLAAALLAAGTAAAETAWVRGELRLNLRTGPSSQHRILGGVKTGDRVEILERREKWTRIRIGSGEAGWIPAGYLDTQPPAALRLARVEQEAAGVRDELASVREENAQLRSGSEAYQEREASQRAELERLTTENRELRAGARWPHWITGASILAAGMVAGGILARVSGRRSSRRIRL